MSSYSFVIGNGIVILLMAVGMGFLGGAETFTSDDVVIGDADALVESGEVSNVSEVDFDTSRLLYEPNFESFEPPVQGTAQGFTWTGNTNNRSQDYGYLTYNVSDVNGEVPVYYENPGFFVTIYAYADGEFLVTDPSGDAVSNTLIYDLTDDDEFEIRIESTDTVFIGFGEDSGLSRDNFVASDEVEQTSYTVEQGFFSKVTDLIIYSFSAVGEVFSTLKAWVDFVWIMPGLIGWFMKGYIGILVAYFIVTEIWLG